MLVRAKHTTTYIYSEPVSICHTLVHLAPRAVPGQEVLGHTLEVTPVPEEPAACQDYFGNNVAYFSIHEPHRTLTITGSSVVDLDPPETPLSSMTPPWEQVRDSVRERESPESTDAYPFTFESTRVSLGTGFADYAKPSFKPGRPLLDAALDLSGRIYSDFRYDPRATTVSTPVAEVLRNRRGVCQDFAHLMIACLRSVGLPARYVSGYLRRDKGVVGGDASHAWVALFCPGFTWLDIDPTNNVMPHGGHVTVAIGRDYSDVTPVKGVALGGGEQVISVAVSVTRVSAAV